MKYILLPLAALLCVGLGCTPSHTHSHDGHSHDGHSHDGHSHDGHDHGGHDHGAPALAAVPFTLYTERTELFVEIAPFIAGEENRLAVHLTALGDLFSAVGEGRVTASLGGAVSAPSESPDPAGLFLLRLTPDKAGVFQLVFDIQTPDFTDQIKIADVQVYASRSAARAAQVATPEEGDISYTKEQAWKVEFASAPARVLPFSEVLRTSGQLLPVPGEEVILAAQISGIVSFVGKSLMPGSAVASRTTLFSVKSSEAVKSNLGAAVQQAEQDLATAKAQLDRATTLLADQLIPQKEYLEAKLRFDNAQTRLADQAVARRFNQSQQSVATPMTGFLKSVLVENGQFVQAGQALATVSQQKRLLLRADVSQRYFPKIGLFTAANFKAAGSETVFSTRDLNGRVASYGKAGAGGMPFVPLYFELDNVGALIPGSVVEVFLQAGAQDALVVPLSALLEEQGFFYVYVQVGGESFRKQEVQLGASDGLHVQVRSGIREGERVVTRGAYQIKLATAAGALPAHSHEH